ncbi:hypothetical protein POTOM_007928 [Populus tomentosa]|uniref:Secreted protein n=1 Tax=Populus tomentosa TaxID=118781 RepID=A0A8X8AB19_POPTO|nr:hypothetical protein POTOM_007928 [Populus tomentosa]
MLVSDLRICSFLDLLFLPAALIEEVCRIGIGEGTTVAGWEVVMVCQAASQTNFRALKHENGIAGCATIIVRVIACFQPLQDCQVSVIELFLAEYFRHLLKPVT